MKYFVISPHDQRHQLSFFFEIQAGRRRPRPQFADLACPVCLKIDEEVAITRELDGTILRKAKGDILYTDDGVLCVSERVACAFMAAGVSGFEFLRLRENQNYLGVRLTIRVPVHLRRASYRIERECRKCGRPEWRGGGAPLEAMLELPQISSVVFSTEIPYENAYGRYWDFYCSEPVAQLMWKNKWSGFIVESVGER